MEQEQDQHEKAVQVAQMYYYQNLPMKRIAAELQVSHSTISRLLAWARNEGLIEIKINDLRGRSSPLEEMIKLKYQLRNVMIVSVAEVAGEHVWQDRVARMAANHLNLVMENDFVLGVVVGEMVNLIASYLTPKPLLNTAIVQLNGTEAPGEAERPYSAFLIAKIASNYQARPHFFQLPSHFDYAATKAALWRESFMQKIINLQQKSDIVIFSPEEISNGRDEKPGPATGVGSIANTLINRNGLSDDIEFNQRVCGPELALLKSVNRSICVVSGKQRLGPLKATLTGRYVSDLIIDEPTARQLIATFSENEI